MNHAFPAVLSLAAIGWVAVPAFADDKPPPPSNPGTTLRPGSGGDLKGTTVRGTTLRAGSGGDLKGTTMRGTTRSGTTTRAGSGVAAAPTVATSAPGSPDAAHAGAAAKAAGHGRNAYWNEQYYGAPLLARRVVVVEPAPVVVAAESAPAKATGTVRVVDRGVPPPRPSPAVPTDPSPAVPTAYVEPPRAAVVPASPALVVPRTAHGPRLRNGSFGGIGTYSGYETWGPTGCDCR